MVGGCFINGFKRFMEQLAAILLRGCKKQSLLLAEEVGFVFNTSMQ
jgi:hypothetical protein